MEPPPDYKDVVSTNSIPSAPSYARVFQQTAQQASALFGELEWKNIRQEKRQHFPDEGGTSFSSSVAPESARIGPERLFDGREIMNRDLGNGQTTTGRHKAKSSQRKSGVINVGYLEGQRMFSNRITAVSDHPERFQDEEEDCNTVVEKQSSSRQAVSIPEKAFGATSSQNETLLNQAQLGRYFYRTLSREEQRELSFERENEENERSRIVTVQPTSEQNAPSQNKFPVRSHSLSPGSPKHSIRKQRRESYVYSETREIGVQVEAERIAAKKTYCFVNVCFCVSCRCAICSTSCSCTWLHCVPCLAYSVLCCPFWFVCLFCSFINPCWKEILLVTSGALKHLAFSCRSVAANNCSFTCLADDVEETLWNARKWGCGFEKVDEI